MYGLGGLQKGVNKTKALLIAGGVVLALLAGTASFLVWQSVSAEKGPTSGSKEENAVTTDRIIKQVSELYVVPEDEEPTVAAIQDKSKLEGQEFFNKAENGDYLLVYSEAKLALLYRESADKLINVGPVNLQDSETSTPVQ